MSRRYDPRFDVPISGRGFYAEYFALTSTVSSLEDIDFDARPLMVANVDELNDAIRYDPFWDGGPMDWFAARYSSQLSVDIGGEYTFFLNSDDGSALYIDGERVLNNDGLHGAVQQQVAIDLSAGTRDIEVRYFEAYGGQTLQLSWQAPDASRATVVDAAVLSYENVADPETTEVDDDDDLADLPPILAFVKGLKSFLGLDLSDDDDDDSDDDQDDDDETDDPVVPPVDDTADEEDEDPVVPPVVEPDVPVEEPVAEEPEPPVEEPVAEEPETPADPPVEEPVAEEPANPPQDETPTDDVGDMGDGGMDHGDDTGGDMGDGGMDHGDDTDGDMGDGGMDHGDGHGDDTGGDMGDGGMDHGDDHGDDTGGDMGDGGMDHGDGHGDMDHGDHGDAPMPQPTTPAEVEAFVRDAMAEPEGHFHGAGDDRMVEHGQMLDLVPRSEATHIAVADGDWFDASTWYEGRIPDADAKVFIPKGVSVNYNGESEESIFTVRVDGELTFATDVDTKMLVDTFVVDSSGRLEIGTADNPIQANVNAEIVIANNGDIDTSWDSTLLSRGVISHGEVEIHGAEKDSFIKVSDAPMRGDTSLTLEEVPEGWQVGDTIIVTGTHKTGWTNTSAGHIESQDEEVTITAINGNQISFDTALRYDHDAPREDLGAYISNMSRNITFSSEDGDASATHHRGHVMFMHNDDVDVRYAAFDDLGRTDKSVAAFDVDSLGYVDAGSNIKGRYSFHFHKTGTEDQDDPAMAVGNAVSGGPGWGFVHHSSNANFTDNVAYDVFGAAFAAESGDETGVWVRNMAIKSEGIGFGEWSAKQGPDVGRMDTGRTGDGFFFQGRLVEAAENVAVNTTNGFVWMHRNAGADPLVDSLDHPEIGYGADTMLVNLTPIQGFRDNEAYGTHTGIIVIKSNAAQQQHELRSVFDGFLNWETNQGVDISYTAHYTMRDFDLISSDNIATGAANVGVEIGSMAFDLVFNGLRIDGFDTGVDVVQDFFRPVADADVDHIFIDMETTDVGRDFLGFNGARHHVLSSSDLTPGRLDFVHNRDTSMSEGEDFSLGGIKTDSIGTRNREYDGDPLTLEFYKQIGELITSEGYYKTEDGRNVLIIEDFIVDRATGEVQKFAHIVNLEMTDAQLQENWMFNNYFDGVVYNGVITMNGTVPVARDDSASVRAGEEVLIDAIANDFDNDGDALRVDGFIDPTHGDVYQQENGELLYRPDVGFTGTDSFRYWAADDEGNFVDATVTVDVW